MNPVRKSSPRIGILDDVECTKQLKTIVVCGGISRANITGEMTRRVGTLRKSAPGVKKWAGLEASDHSPLMRGQYIKEATSFWQAQPGSAGRYIQYRISLQQAIIIEWWWWPRGSACKTAYMQYSPKPESRGAATRFHALVILFFSVRVKNHTRTSIPTSILFSDHVQDF